MISNARIHAQLSMAATEGLSGSEQDGKRDLDKSSKQRAELRQDIEANAEKAAQLAEDLADAGDTNFWQKVGDFFTGRNRAGEVQEKQAENQARLEMQQNELEIVKAEAKDIMSELESAQSDLQGTNNALQEILKDEETTKDISSLG